MTSLLFFIIFRLVRSWSNCGWTHFLELIYSNLLYLFSLSYVSLQLGHARQARKTSVAASSRMSSRRWPSWTAWAKHQVIGMHHDSYILSLQTSIFGPKIAKWNFNKLHWNALTWLSVDQEIFWFSLSPLWAHSWPRWDCGKAAHPGTVWWSTKGQRQKAQASDWSLSLASSACKERFFMACSNASSRADLDLASHLRRSSCSWTIWNTMKHVPNVTRSWLTFMEMWSKALSL